MKKLLVVLTLILTVFMGACTSAPNDTDLESRVLDLENELNAVQSELDSVNSYLDRMVFTGYVLPEDNGENIEMMNNLFLSVNGYEFLTSEKDYVDKTKFPDYIWDDLGEYISVDDLCNLLTQKYLGLDSTCEIGFQLRIKVNFQDEYSKEEFIVRVSMLVMELSEYDFYTLDSPQLQIVFDSGSYSYMNVRMSLLVTDKYVLHPAMFWQGLLDTEIQNFTYDYELVDAIYQGYLDNLTFDGYVLPNYK